MKKKNSQAASRDTQPAVPSWLVTWNPKKWEWDDFALDLAKVRSGRQFRRPWAFRSLGVASGDRVFLHRQGHDSPGIVASGYAISSPYRELHWAENDRTARYVDILWDTLVDPQKSEQLPRDRMIETDLVEGPWNSQQSGVRIRADIALQLESVWRAHLLNLDLLTRAKLEFEIDDQNDYAIEDRKAEVKVRMRQSVFRRRVLANFSQRCCLTGVTESDLIVASHIVPWAANHECRLDPSNGLCLFVTFDNLFDRGYVSFSDHLSVIAGSLSGLSDSLAQLVKDVEGMKASPPVNTPINPEFLAYHRDNILKK